MQRFAYAHNFTDAAVFHARIQFVHGIAMHEFAPGIALAEYGRELRHVRILRRDVRLILAGHEHDHRPVHKLEPKHIRIFGAGRHFTVKIILVIPKAIYVEIAELAPLQKPCLIKLAVLFKECDRLVNGKAPALKRQCRADNEAHFAFKAQYILLGQSGVFFDCNVQPRPEGIAHLYARRREKPAHRGNQDELQRTFINAAARFFPIAQKMHVHVFKRRIAQAEFLAANLCRERAFAQRNAVQFKFFYRIQQAFAMLEFCGDSVHRYLHNKPPSLE